MDDDMGDEEEEEEGMGGDRDRDRQSSRMPRNRNNRHHEEDDEDDDDEGEGEGEGEGYDQSSADGSPDRHTSAHLSTGGTHIDRGGERNGEHEDDMSSLSRLMHNTATATAHTNSSSSNSNSNGSSNSNAIPFRARNSDPTQLSADSGSSADRPYGGQGLGVEGNQLEYLEESFQLIALMVRGNAARIKDDMK